MCVMPACANGGSTGSGDSGRPGADGSLDAARPDGGPDAGAMDAGARDAGGDSSSCTPTDEVCNGVDDDCNGTVDDGSDPVLCPRDHAAAACEGGACVIRHCDPGFGDCDGMEANGCEKPTDTDTDCGECGIACGDVMGATTHCEGGMCVPDSCMDGFSDCDGSPGCEVEHGRTPNSCTTAELVGRECGDTSCGFLCPGTSASGFGMTSGNTSLWVHAIADECSSCCADLTHTVRLTVPAGVDYDMIAYRDCTGAGTSATRGPGMPETVTLTASDDCGGGDTGFDYWIHVQWVSGSSCDSWTLSFTGRGC